MVSLWLVVLLSLVYQFPDVINFNSLAEFQNHVNLVVTEGDLLNIFLVLELDQMLPILDVADDVLNPIDLIHLYEPVGV